MTRSFLKTLALSFSFLTLALCSCTKKPIATIELTPSGSYDKGFVDKQVEQAVEGRLQELHVQAKATMQGGNVHVDIVEMPDTVDMILVEKALAWSGKLQLRESQGNVVDLSGKVKNAELRRRMRGSAICVEFVESFHKTLATITDRNLLETMPIVMDDSVLTSPRVLAIIDSGCLEIDFVSISDLEAICVALNHPFPVSMKVGKTE